MNLSNVNIIKNWATIFSMVATPIVVAVIGWMVQANISSKEVERDYVNLAMQILMSQPEKNSDDLRTWALDVINSKAPIPLTKAAGNEILDGAISGLVPPVQAPVNALTKCQQLNSPKKGDPYEVYISYLLDSYYDCALRHDALVKWSLSK